MSEATQLGVVPQGVQAALVSTPAAAAIVPGMNGATLAREASAADTYTDIGLTVADAGANLASGTLGKVGGPVSVVASGAFNIAGNALHHERDIEKLLEVYRDTVSAQLGVPAAAVNEADLRVAASKFPENKALLQAFEHMDEQSVNAPVRSIVSGAAALVGGAAGALAGGGIASMATGLAGSMAASRAADGVMDSVLGKENNNTVFAALQQADANLQSGKGVSAMDMFLFHVAADSKLAAQIEGHMGDRFEDLPQEKKTRTMLRDHPILTELCKYEAYLLNSKSIPAAALMDERLQAEVRKEFEQLYAQAQTPDNRIQAMGSQISPLAPRSQIVVQQPTPAQQAGYAQAIAEQRAAQQTAQPVIN